MRSGHESVTLDGTFGEVLDPQEREDHEPRLGDPRCDRPSGRLAATPCLAAVVFHAFFAASSEKGVKNSNQTFMGHFEPFHL